MTLAQPSDRVLSVLLTAEEYGHVDGVAGRYGLSPAEFMRRMARNVAAINEAFKVSDMPRKDLP